MLKIFWYVVLNLVSMARLGELILWASRYAHTPIHRYLHSELPSYTEEHCSGTTFVALKLSGHWHTWSESYGTCQADPTASIRVPLLTVFHSRPLWIGLPSYCWTVPQTRVSEHMHRWKHKHTDTHTHSHTHWSQFRTSASLTLSFYNHCFPPRLLSPRDSQWPPHSLFWRNSELQPPVLMLIAGNSTMKQIGLWKFPPPQTGLSYPYLN